MNRNYTLEDVETLRKKAGVSYEDAVALLDKYDGDLTRAMVELEKRGQLGASAHSAGRFNGEEAGDWIRRLWRQSLNMRILVECKGERVAYLPLLFVLLMLVLGPYAVIAAVVVALITGCSVSIQGLEKPVKTVVIRENPSRGDAVSQAEEEAPAPAENGEDEKGEDDFPTMTIS